MKQVVSTPKAPTAIGPYSQDILEEAGTSMANVIKTTVFMADMADFADMNAVYAEFFAEPFPARSAVAVKTLPKGALVEIEVIAEI